MTAYGTEGRTDDLEVVELDRFAATLRFVANHDLWDEAKQYLVAEGVSSVVISASAIRVFKRLVSEELLGNSRVSGRSADQANRILESGCGVTNPGPPGGGPVFPHTVTDGGVDGGSDAGGG